MSSSLIVVVSGDKLEEIEQLGHGENDNTGNFLKRGMAALQNEFAELQLEGEKIAKEIMSSSKTYSLNELEMFASGTITIAVRAII